MENATCPPRNQLPTHGNLPIADDIDYVLRAGTNTSDLAMTACCAPNPVNFVDGCFLWCEYPNRYSNESLTQFSTCIVENGGEEAALAGSLPDSATSTGAPSMMALALAVLIFSLMSSAWERERSGSWVKGLWMEKMRLCPAMTFVSKVKLILLPLSKQSNSKLPFMVFRDGIQQSDWM